MPTIVGNKIGRVINLMIDGNVFQKKCDTSELADEFFKLVIAAKNGGNTEYINLMGELNRINRILVNGILEKDKNEHYYLQGFNHPVPQLLVDTLLEYSEKNFPIDAIVNFWKLLMLNPDKLVRDQLFKFLSHYQFAITDNGYFTAYKVVVLLSKGFDQALIDFVDAKFARVKQNKKSPKNYFVIHNPAEEEYTTIIGKNANDIKISDGYVLVGNLEELNTKILSNDGGGVVYTDKYNGTTRIKLGHPVRKDRQFETHLVECSSNGLHVGSTPYVNNFFNPGNIVLTVLINPAHVIHVPTGESTKLRTAEYYPYALLEIENEKNRESFSQFKIIDQPYFETDYAAFEKEKIEEDLAMIRLDEANQIPKSETQIDTKKILEQRLVDLTKILSK